MSNRDLTVLPTEFNADYINFLPPRPNKLGGQSVLINYVTDDRRPLVMQTPRMRLPFGVDQSKPQNGEPSKYHISLSMGSDETSNETTKQFVKNIRDIDGVTKSFAQTSDKWFGKKLSEELVNEFYKSSEKFPKDPKWNSTLKVKLPFDKQGNPQFRVFDDKKNEVNILGDDGQINTDVFPKGCEAVCIIQPTGVWFVGKTQFGVGYKLLQAKVYKNNKLTGYFIQDSDEEEEETETETEHVE